MLKPIESMKYLCIINGIFTLILIIFGIVVFINDMVNKKRNYRIYYNILK